jgi:hypothetical protein
MVSGSVSFHLLPLDKKTLLSYGKFMSILGDIASGIAILKAFYEIYTHFKKSDLPTMV